MEHGAGGGCIFNRKRQVLYGRRCKMEPLWNTVLVAGWGQNLDADDGYPMHLVDEVPPPRERRGTAAPCTSSMRRDTSLPHEREDRHGCPMHLVDEVPPQ